MTSKLSHFSNKVSQVNVLPGSTPSLKRSVSYLNVSQKSEEDESDSDSSDELRINWGDELKAPNLCLPREWGFHGLEENLWDDTRKPTVQFKSYEELNLNPAELKGVLTDRIFATCSSYLDKSPETNRFVLCKANLSKKNLRDIRILKFHHFLQYIDLSYNNLTNIEALGELPFLMYLDVSRNHLERLLNFRAPYYLTYINYSFNEVSNISDLTPFWSVVHLDLSHNQIKHIEGLQDLKYLRHLNLSYNLITTIENLNHMRLLSLDLESNLIEFFEEDKDKGLKTLPDILKLKLDFNRLSTIRFCKGINTLQSLSIKSNEIKDLLEISYLEDLNFLSEVDFRDNPITVSDRYFETCIYNVKYISFLDGGIVDAEAKIAAKNVFEASIQTEAFRNLSSALFIQQLNDPVLGLPIIPFDTPPAPIIILVGPPGCEKARLLKKFCNLNPKYTIIGQTYTTRPIIENQDQSDLYHHITLSEFWNMAHNGEFLAVSQILGHCFGFAQEELEKTVGKSCALVLQMDLKGALTMRAHNMKCRLVLAMPSSQEAHISNILKRYRIFDETVKQRGEPKTELAAVKAKKLLQNYNTIAKEIEKTVDSVSETLSDKGSLISKDDNESGTELDKHAMYGILKGSIHRSKSETPQLASKNIVTFQTDEKKNRSALYVSRSVTFTDLVPPQQSYVKSISSTLIGDLSALSDCSTNQEEKPNSLENILSTSVNIESSSLEFVVIEILKTRDSYLAFHQSNPGVIYAAIFTDREEESLNILKEVLKNCINSQSRTAPNYEFQKDSAYHAIVASRLKYLHQEISNEMSIGKKQLGEFSIKTRKGKPYESNMKRSAKDVIQSMKTKRSQVLSYKLPEEVGIPEESLVNLLND